ncbi:MAG: recombinase [Bacteroidetes bacterium HGW-Bacteroidetes-21]|jgi:integrase|nr:MAG: recombinase [Bacteroidetes bacterium HGW-Bacteroidetes-21]
MSSIKIQLYTSKTLKNGEHPIMLRIIKDRRPKYVSMGISCSKELWDDTNNLPKRKHPLYKEIIMMLEKKRSDALKTVYAMETKDDGYSSEEVQKKIIKKKRSGSASVFNYFDETITRLKNTGRVGYAEVFTNTKNSLKTFRKNRDFLFTDITYSFLVHYEESFLERGVQLNSIFVFMRTFKTLINNAKKDEIVSESFNPFKDFSFSKYRRIKTKKRTISKDDIKKIEAKKLESGSSLLHSRNIFLFSYYCRGITFIDIANLKWSNIQNNRLIYTRKKTNELFNMAILEPAQKILKFYKSKNKDNGNPYIFPILNETHDTDSSKDNRIKKIITRTNKDLKAIAKLAEVNEHITTYVARHTYATVLKKSGISTSLISEMMGHDSEKTTQIYLDSFENSVLDEANKSIL